MDAEVRGEHSLERRRQLLLVLELVCADREVDAVGAPARGSRSLGDMAFGDVPAEDEAKVVRLFNVAIH